MNKSRDEQESIGMNICNIWPHKIRRREQQMKNALAAGKHKAGARRNGRQDGFTLVEILVVITIIGLIMGLVGPRVLNYLSQSKVKAANIQIQSFASSLDLFYLDLGRYPTTSEGLPALVTRPGGASAWNGPYLNHNSVPNDPWGHAYKYHAPGEHTPYETISLGSDGQEGGTGTAADIKSSELR
jgi:general secretion pathway protein G